MLLNQSTDAARRWLAQSLADRETIDVFLWERCAAYDPTFSDLRKQVKNLDQFYVEARYPNGLPDQDDAAGAVQEQTKET